MTGKKEYINEINLAVTTTTHTAVRCYGKNYANCWLKGHPSRAHLRTSPELSLYNWQHLLISHKVTAPSCLDSSVVRVLQQYRRGRGLESFFRLFFFLQLLTLRT